MTEQAKKVWDYINSNLDTSNAIVIAGIMDIANCSADKAEIALIQWAMGNKQWFEDNFATPMMGISY